MKTLLIISIIVLSFFGCNQDKHANTIENLKEAIKGETIASAKYAAFALKAKEEGHNNIAKLFEAASKSEDIHAANHMKVLRALKEKMDDFTPEYEVKSTPDNLQNGIEGETYEVNDMYPKFITVSNEERVNKARKSLTWALYAEKKHQEFFLQAWEALRTKSENTLPVQYLVCPLCGNTYDFVSADDNCAFCLTPKEKFHSM